MRKGTRKRKVAAMDGRWHGLGAGVEEKAVTGSGDRTGGGHKGRYCRSLISEVQEED